MRYLLREARTTAYRHRRLRETPNADFQLCYSRLRRMFKQLAFKSPEELMFSVQKFLEHFDYFPQNREKVAERLFRKILPEVEFEKKS